MNVITDPRRDKNGHLKAGIRMPGWDYTKAWIYMITLTVKDRQPILGEIKEGKMLYTPLGVQVAEAWKNLGKTFPEVEPCQYAVMPEHFHGIVWVHKKLSSPLGEIIRSFKIACTKANGGETFWFPGLHDTILSSRGQLKKMTRYILRNAERRWAVMRNPDLFKVARGLDLESYLETALGERSAKPEIAIGSRPALPERRTELSVVGNHFLIENPNKLLIQVSRRASEEEIWKKVDEAILFAARGGVIVSGCISPGERAIATAVREAGFPLIAIIPRGFGPYFKPKGEYFDACAEGRLLMISPYAPMTKKEPLTRTRCFEVNSLAARLCGDDPNTITYRGSSPRDFGL